MTEPRLSMTRRVWGAAFWLAAGGLFVAGLFVVADGPEAGDVRTLTLVLALLGESLLVVLWLAAAAGFGLTLSGLIFGTVRPAPPLQLTIGVAAMIALAWLAGLAGLLNTWSAWGLNGVGWALWVFALRTRRGEIAAPTLPWLLAMPAVGLLLGAATIAPGVLWKPPASSPTAHPAYRVLSHHLQMPKEWMAGGAIRGLEHNVYSYLPGGFEAAYLQIGWMRGEMIHAGLACQLLHAAMAILAATVIAAMTRQLLVAGERSKPTAIAASRGSLAGGDAATQRPDNRRAATAGAAAGALYLATPWVTATGSIALNDQAMVALGAGGLALALSERGFAAGPRGLAAGWLCGVAALCNVTGLSMFALPTALVLLWRGPVRPLPRIGSLLAFLLGLALPLGALAFRNLAWTGNPLFPLATELLGTGHWTAEQAARWQAAHLPSGGLMDRLARLGPRIAAAPWFGYAIWPLAALGFFVGLVRGRFRRITWLAGLVLAIQAAAWLSATTMESRLAMPILATACVLTGGVWHAMRRPVAMTLAVGVIIGWLSYAGVQAYRGQLNGYAARFIDGTQRMIEADPRSGPLNDLPRGARVYAEGFAIPFYVQRPLAYHSPWDRSELGRLLEAYGVAGGLSRLRERGFTHLLIDWGMLEGWMSEGGIGYDPAITARRLELIRKADLPVVARVPSVLTLYKLENAD